MAGLELLRAQYATFPLRPRLTFRVLHALVFWHHRDPGAELRVRPTVTWKVYIYWLVYASIVVVYLIKITSLILYFRTCFMRSRVVLNL